MAASILIDFEFTDGNEADESDDGVQSLMFDGGQESGPFCPAQEQSPQHQHAPNSKPEGEVGFRERGAQAVPAGHGHARKSHNGNQGHWPLEDFEHQIQQGLHAVKLMRCRHPFSLRTE